MSVCDRKLFPMSQELRQESEKILIYNNGGIEVKSGELGNVKRVMGDMKFILAKQLKKYLTDRDLSVSDLARKSGIPRKTIYNWVEGQPPKNISQVYAVAKVLEVGIEALCFGEADQRGNDDLVFKGIYFGKYDVFLKKIKEDGV